MAIERDALMREVDEELRRDQLKKLWDQYGTYAVAGIAAIVLGVAGYKWWDGRRVAAAEAAGLRFEEAMNLSTSGRTADAQKEFAAIAASGRGGYQALAQLTLAGAAAKAGRTDDAIAAFEGAARATSDALVRDYAMLQAAALKTDSADFTEIQNRLTPLTGDKSPWRYAARELLGISALRAGRLEDGRNYLAPLSADPRAPAATRERAAAMMNLVVAAELEKAAPAKVELEKTDPPAPAAETPPKEAPRTKAGPPPARAAPPAAQKK